MKYFQELLIVLLLAISLSTHAGSIKEGMTSADTPAYAPPKVVEFRDCPDCPEMVTIPAGNFDMGSDNSEDSDKPVHHVIISHPFAIGKTEVTQGQWKAIMGNNPSASSKCGDNCPVENVSWNDAQEYIQRLNAKTGKQYRLPSEAEWEYACRAGGRQQYCGSDDADSVAWYKSNAVKTTHPVSGKQPNVFGLYDMSGNVREWTQDCWNRDYNGAPVDGSAWNTGNCDRRILRGGSWMFGPPSIRATFRYSIVAFIRYDFDGFRVTRSLP